MAAVTIRIPVSPQGHIPMPGELLQFSVEGYVRAVQQNPQLPTTRSLIVEIELTAPGAVIGLRPSLALASANDRCDRFVPQQGAGSIDT